MTSKPGTSLQGNLALLFGEHPSFSSSQFQLLNAIAECGSISKAAKAVGISYKTAWDRIDAMNNMSQSPLVVRSAGGAQGGGTVLTELGERIIDGFQALQDEHAAFIQRLGARLHTLNDVASFIRSESMMTSARNQFRGKITRIVAGAVNAEVELEIGDANTLTAIITNDSVGNLGLEAGGSAIALIKASWVILSKQVELKSSARNKLIGKVSRIVEGSVNSDVTIDLGEGKSISAVITNTSLAELELQQADPACALFKASSVILMAE